MPVSFLKHNCLAILVQGFFVLAFIGGYIAFLVSFYNQNREQTIAAEFLPKNQSATEVVTLSVSLVSVSPADYVMQVSVDLENFPDSWRGSDNSLNHSFTIGVGRVETTVQPSGNFKPIVTNIPLVKGSFDLYPFDSYDSEVAIYVFDGASFSTSSVDLAVGVSNAVFYGFSFTVDQRLLFQDVGDLLFLVSITRTDLFRLYPVFLIIAFWLVGLAVATLASTLVIWNKRKVEPPVLGSVIALIFALPAFRNSAPQSPPIGCTMDVVSFYWAMLVVILSVIGLIIRYLQQAPAPPPGGDFQHNMVTKLGAARRKLHGIENEDTGDVPMQDITK